MFRGRFSPEPSHSWCAKKWKRKFSHRIPLSRLRTCHYADFCLTECLRPPRTFRFSRFAADSRPNPPTHDARKNENANFRIEFHFRGWEPTTLHVSVSFDTVGHLKLSDWHVSRTHVKNTHTIIIWSLQLYCHARTRNLKLNESRWYSESQIELLILVIGNIQLYSSRWYSESQIEWITLVPGISN